MTKLESIIKDEIRKTGGVLPFCKFMEIALFWKDLGYYEQDRPVTGKNGDYYTSVSTGFTFGWILAYLISEIHKAEPRLCNFSVIEVGAHNGQLAKDILSALRQIDPELSECIRYVIAEPSDKRKKLQQAVLSDFSGKVNWLKNIEECKDDSISGLILSNELLDSMPVCRMTWNKKHKNWVHQGVSFNSKSFVWNVCQEDCQLIENLRSLRLSWDSNNHANQDFSQWLPDINCKSLGLPESLLEVLVDGFVIDLNLSSIIWWATACKKLHKGAIITFDYGYNNIEMFRAEMARGRAKSFYRHTVSTDLLGSPGEKDLTAPINFEFLQIIGSYCGLETRFMDTQERFLSHLILRLYKAQPHNHVFSDGVFTKQFITLISPNHLGNDFKVLVQTKGLAAKNLFNFVRGVR